MLIAAASSPQGDTRVHGDSLLPPEARRGTSPFNWLSWGKLSEENEKVLFHRRDSARWLRGPGKVLILEKIPAEKKELL